MSEDNHLADDSDYQLDLLFAKAPFDRSISLASNNVIVGLRNLILGIFSLGVFSLLYTFYNGFIFGTVLGKGITVLPVNEILWATLPHCTEILGIILLGNLGFVLSLKIIFNVNLYSRNHYLFLLAFSFIIIIISAFLESYVSMSV